jgi:tRNA C32,U32 (ribose-2'-O)-methylase TrmJ
MLSAIKNNIYPAMALMILPCGYFIGTELRERNDAKKILQQVEQVPDQEQIEKLRQQLEALKEEREMVRSKIQKPE